MSPGHILSTFALMSEAERKLTMRILFLALYVKMVVRFGQFPSLLALVRSGESGASAVDRESCEIAERAVRRVWSTLPLRGRCLEIALTLAIVLRDEGAAAEVRLGVGPDMERFTAHAWVEVPSCGYVGSFDDSWTQVAALG